MAGCGKAQMRIVLAMIRPGLSMGLLDRYIRI